MNTLRAILCQKNTVEQLTRTFSAAGTVHCLRSTLIPHVAAVMQRVEVATGEEHERFWVVKLAALMHEIPPTELGATLQCAGVADVATCILAILNGFGQVWRIKTQDERQRYVNAHRVYLKSLLLFEVAHEGAATDEMRAVASLGGLKEQLETWSARLAAAHLRSTDLSSTKGNAELNRSA